MFRNINCPCRAGVKISKEQYTDKLYFDLCQNSDLLVYMEPGSKNIHVYSPLFMKLGDFKKMLSDKYRINNVEEIPARCCL